MHEERIATFFVLPEQSSINNSRRNSGKMFNPVELPFSNLDKNGRIISVMLGIEPK